MPSLWCAATCGWRLRVVHCPPPTLIYGKSRPLCTTGLSIPLLTPLELRKVQINRRNNNLMPRDMTTVYTEWLAALFERQGGASLDRNSVTLQSFRRTPKSHKNPTNAKGPDAVMHGNLTVGDPEAFANLVANGAGRHKAYGYGMLIIRAVLN